MTTSAPQAVTVERDWRGRRALAWWTRHCHPRDGDPATRAKLRRCRSAVEALSVPAAVALARVLIGQGVLPGVDDWRWSAGLDLARVLAHVAEHDPARSVMRSAGWRTFPGDRKESEAGDDRPRLSEARFRRLVETGRGEEQVDAFTRLIALLDGSVNVSMLAEDFWYWSDRTKRRWAFDYYAAGIAAPADGATPFEDSDE
ncbi:MAG TPA: type I-E CRISPR-associated protein Cse2/CasB [Gemmatimonadaceae bacterium]